MLSIHLTYFEHRKPIYNINLGTITISIYGMLRCIIYVGRLVD